MKASLVRQCLQMLSDDEIDELLSSSPALRRAVRMCANKPKSTRVDAQFFRRWMRMPSTSDALLPDLPRQYSGEMRLRSEGGELIHRTVGMRAVLALHERPESTPTLFRALLDEIRATPESAPEPDWSPDRSGADDADRSPVADSEVRSIIPDRDRQESDDEDAEAPVPDMATGLDSAGVNDLIDRLRNTADQVAEVLERSAGHVRAGRVLSTDTADSITVWNAALTESWSALGVSASEVTEVFLALEAARDRLLAAEKSAAAEQADRIAKTHELETLREGADSLAAMAGMGDTFQTAYEQALNKISALQQELGLTTDDTGPARPQDDEPVTDKDDPLVADGAANSSAAPEETDTPSAEEPEATSDDATTSPSDSRMAAGAGDTANPSRSVDLAFPAETATYPAADTTAEDGVAAVHSSDSKHTIDPGCVDELVVHVWAGKFGAAWLVAQAARMADLDVAAYRLAAAAFRSGPGGLEAADVLVRVTTMMSEAAEFHSPQSAKVALAATLRAALTAGWSPRSEVDRIVRQASLDEKWRDVVDSAVAAGDRNYQHLQDAGVQVEHSPAPEDSRERARDVQHKLKQQRINFTRADKVLRHLLREHEPLGAALAAVAAPTTGEERRAALTRTRAVLESPHSLIDHTDVLISGPQQRRSKPIERHARNSLIKAIEQVNDCVTEALTAAVTIAGDAQGTIVQESRHNLVVAAKSVCSDSELSGPGDAAMRRLADWILAPTVPSPAASAIDVLIEESLPVTSVTRDAEGLPVIDDGSITQIMAELHTPRSDSELFAAYVERGDLQEAAVAARHDADLTARLHEEAANWQRKLRREVDAIRAEIGRTYADDFVAGAHAAAEAALVEPAQYQGPRFDLQITVLEQLRTDLAHHRARTAERLRHAAEEISIPDDKDRVSALIDTEDFIGANELLALARNGPLPAVLTDHDNPVGAHVTDAFAVALAELDISRLASIDDVIAQMAAPERASEVSAPHGDLERLSAWNNLIPRGRAKPAPKQTVFPILRALGLDPRGEPMRRTKPGVRHFELYQVHASPVDGSLVPGLGSRAPHYMVAATTEPNLLRDTLTSAFPMKSGPNIVLFQGVLTLEQRQLCLRVCRDNKISAIVVDYAVAAFVATHYPRSFRAVQQVTLPFTCFTHYSIVAGGVPEEVFVGRAAEQDELTNPKGSLFVYGGRQLGKSALLRKIEHDFGLVDDHHAIYIDLNSHGIGTWSESGWLWQVLYNELVKIESFGLKANPNVRKPDPVQRAIGSWLDRKESRRLLLLLDEADAFLEKESSETPSRAFKTINPLKGMFDSSGGRFKPVFAGLHKVQRLQNVANTPLAHGGRDVLVGPLAAKPAHDLVVKPLEALGYRFAEPTLVWRLLAFTNLQPGLIQIVCTDLVEHLQLRPPRRGEPLITITADDIDRVTQDPRTREKIAERLRLTIRLEDRYRVIALAVAIMCMDDSFAETYSARDIRDHCELYWPQGFADLNTSEFGLYLDELVGLGVLIKDAESNKFSVRSPNVVTMLGSKDQLEIELEENKDQFELPHEYNPRSTRRRLTIDGKDIRSPLSEDDLSRIVPVASHYDATNFVVIGTEALGVTTVADVLNEVCKDRGVTVEVIDADVSAMHSVMTRSGRGKNRYVVIIDATAADTEQADLVARTVLSAQKRQGRHLVVLFGATGVGSARALDEARLITPFELVALEKWSGDGIRSWHDIPFDSPADRRELIERSGGWPELVERAVDRVTNSGISNAQEWEYLSAYPGNQEIAQAFLARAGLQGWMSTVLTHWAQLDSYEPIADIADLLDTEIDELWAMVEDLVLLGIVNDRNGAYMVDPVVARAIHTLA